jgi:hypothetical protein
MGRKTRQRKRSGKKEAEPKSKARRSKFLMIGVPLVGLVVGLAFVYGWSPLARVEEQRGVAAQPASQGGDLLPLSTKGKAIKGWHDMANIPRNKRGRPLPMSQPQPDVAVKPARRSLGSVGSKDVVNLNYAVVNNGNQELVIRNIVTSCGCTTGELSHNIIPPGHRADLKVRFDVGYHKVKSGQRVDRIVWLRTNDPDTPVAEARLTATVR